MLYEVITLVDPLGGFGAAKNLSDFALKGAACSVNPELKRFVTALHAAGKPVGLICIAPALTPLLIGQGARCTIGNEEGVAQAIEAMGGQHQNCAVEDIVVDRQNKLVTTRITSYNVCYTKLLRSCPR